VVAADSRRSFTCPRVLRDTLGAASSFRLRACHPLWQRLSMPLHLIVHTSTLGPYNPGPVDLRFGLFRFRSPLLTESILFLFLRLLRCFTSPGIAQPALCIQRRMTEHYSMSGFPIRKSPDQRVFAAPRSLSQLTTSFIACWRQGIHHVPLVACPNSLLDRLSPLNRFESITFSFQLSHMCSFNNDASTQLKLYMTTHCAVIKEHLDDLFNALNCCHIL